MESISNRMNKVLPLDVKTKKQLQAYYGRIKISKKYFLIKRNQITIADVEDKKCILLQRISAQISDKQLTAVICNKCMSPDIYKSVSITEEVYKDIIKNRCIHKGCGKKNLCVQKQLLFNQRLLNEFICQNQKSDKI